MGKEKSTSREGKGGGVRSRNDAKKWKKRIIKTENKETTKARSGQNKG